MIKVFKEVEYVDVTWTGGGTQSYEATQKIEDKINEFCSQNNLQVKNIFWSSVNENTQHGSSERNVSRVIYLIATVVY